MRKTWGKLSEIVFSFIGKTMGFYHGLGLVELPAVYKYRDFYRVVPVFSHNQNRPYQSVVGVFVPTFHTTYNNNYLN